MDRLVKLNNSVNELIMLDNSEQVLAKQLQFSRCGASINRIRTDSTISG